MDLLTGTYCGPYEPCSQLRCGSICLPGIPYCLTFWPALPSASPPIIISRSTMGPRHHTLTPSPHRCPLPLPTSAPPHNSIDFLSLHIYPYLMYLCRPDTHQIGALHPTAIRLKEDFKNGQKVTLDKEESEPSKQPLNIINDLELSKRCIQNVNIVITCGSKKEFGTKHISF